MADEKHDDNHSLLDKLVTVLLRLPWSEVFQDLWKAIESPTLLGGTILTMGRLVWDITSAPPL
jgi:hypothetical protein